MKLEKGLTWWLGKGGGTESEYYLSKSYVYTYEITRE